MRKGSILFGVFAVAAALVAVGCGGDDDETTAALSKQDFIKQADAVCATGDKKIEQEAKKVFEQGRPSRKEQEEFVTSAVLPSIQAQVNGIRALAPPEGDEDEVTAILDAAQNGIDDAEQDPSALTQGGGGNDPFAEANQLARNYGLKVCGQG